MKGNRERRRERAWAATKHVSPLCLVLIDWLTWDEISDLALSFFGIKDRGERMGLVPSLPKVAGCRLAVVVVFDELQEERRMVWGELWALLDSTRQVFSERSDAGPTDEEKFRRTNTPFSAPDSHLRFLFI